MTLLLCLGKRTGPFLADVTRYCKEHNAQLDNSNDTLSRISKKKNQFCWSNTKYFFINLEIINMVDMIITTQFQVSDFLPSPEVQEELQHISVSSQQVIANYWKENYFSWLSKNRIHNIITHLNLCTIIWNLGKQCRAINSGSMEIVCFEWRRRGNIICVDLLRSCTRWFLEQWNVIPTYIFYYFYKYIYFPFK